MFRSARFPVIFMVILATAGLTSCSAPVFRHAAQASVPDTAPTSPVALENSAVALNSTGQETGCCGQAGGVSRCSLIPVNKIWTSIYEACESVGATASEVWLANISDQDIVLHAVVPPGATVVSDEPAADQAENLEAQVEALEFPEVPPPTASHVLLIPPGWVLELKSRSPEYEVPRVDRRATAENMAVMKVLNILTENNVAVTTILNALKETLAPGLSEFDEVVGCVEVAHSLIKQLRSQTPDLPGASDLVPGTLDCLHVIKDTWDAIFNDDNDGAGEKLNVFERFFENLIDAAEDESLEQLGGERIYW
jgi:hypothetical protein